jgi:heat shock protein HslJ
MFFGASSGIALLLHWRQFIAIFAIILIATTKSPHASGLASEEIVETPPINATWRVVEIEGKSTRHHETIKFEAGEVLGKSACNYISASFNQSGSRLQIGAFTVTTMGCRRDRIAAEMRYFKAFRTMRRYTIKENTLLLTGADGRVLMRCLK